MFMYIQSTLSNWNSLWDPGNVRIKKSSNNKKFELQQVRITEIRIIEVISYEICKGSEMLCSNYTSSN